MATHRYPFRGLSFIRITPRLHLGSPPTKGIADESDRSRLGPAARRRHWRSGRPNTHAATILPDHPSRTASLLLVSAELLRPVLRTELLFLSAVSAISGN